MFFALLLPVTVLGVACGRSAPPPAEPQQPPAPTYKLVAQQGVTVPGTDTPVTVGVWIEDGKDRYQPGETLTLYFGMRYDGPEQVTVEAPDTAPLVSAKVVLEGARYHGAPLVEFPSVDSLAAHYAASAKPSPAGWAIAWQTSETQLAVISRKVIVPDSTMASAIMGAGWTEVARIEIPHDGVATWGMIGYGNEQYFSLSGRSYLSLQSMALSTQTELNTQSIRLLRPIE